MPKDSFFGASGGESVDTKNRGNSVVSSLSYSPSQLDAGDVDPVAEADVYLAYGRDLQAEEILREALRVNPERTAIHLKLLEIHAKRRDLRAYEALASDVHKLTGGTGTDWNRVVELGRTWIRATRCTKPAVAASRPRKPPPSPARWLPAAAAAPAAPRRAPPQRLASQPPPPAFVPSVAPLDFDLDLSKPPAAAPKPAAPVSASLPPARRSPSGALAASRMHSASAQRRTAAAPTRPRKRLRHRARRAGAAHAPCAVTGRTKSAPSPPPCAPACRATRASSSST